MVEYWYIYRVPAINATANGDQGTTPETIHTITSQPKDSSSKPALMATTNLRIKPVWKATTIKHSGVSLQCLQLNSDSQIHLQETINGSSLHKQSSIGKLIGGTHSIAAEVCDGSSIR